MSARFIPRYSRLRRQGNFKRVANMPRPKSSDHLPAFMGEGANAEGPEIKNLLYRPGDLVQVIKEGPDYGKISQIYESDSRGIAIENAGREVTTVLPKVYWRDGQSQYAINHRGFMHPNDVRLVTTMQGEDGELVKVAVNKLVLGEYYWDDRYKQRLPRRYVVNSRGLSIPWPDPPAPVTEGNYATSYDVARERTFYVTDVTIPPVPPIALDSLRKKFSRNRKPDLTEDEIMRLTPPKMPLSEGKKAYLVDQAAKAREALTREESGETAALQERTAKFLAERLAKFDAQQTASS
ncbi:uncharacterized protein V1518DRAFT_409148 [Limtongia smithiae]|uniref:uncharacterized protein n=1 Tax=Limtongia smithiae TaxID=1125753 RepID=UPI0034CF874A